MGFELTTPLALVLGVGALAAVGAVWAFMRPPLSAARARLSLGLRALIVILLAFALAGLQSQTTPTTQSLVVAADVSASVQGVLDGEAAMVRQVLQARQGADQVGVVSFARDAQVETAVTTDPQFAQFQTQPNPHYTDIAGALQLSGSLLPRDTRRHIVLLSDGQANLGDAIAEARLQHAEGVRVDVAPLAVPAGFEAYVDSVDAPASLQTGEQAKVTAHIVTNVATPATARWYLDRTLIATAQLSLPAGDTTLTQTVAPTQPGFHSIRLVIDPLRDTYAENNLGEALIQVRGAARVLLVEGAPGRAAAVAAALASVGMQTQVIDPKALPRTAADLAAYQSVVLVNVSAADLGQDSMSLLQASVRDLGMGLVVIGGGDSYGPGGYAGTPLEATLPVQIQIPKDMQKPPVAVMLVLESTESQQGDQILRGAAEGVVGQLTSRDEVGVTNGTMGTVIVPLGPLTNKQSVKSQIDNMDLGDPPTYSPDLTVAEQALTHVKASVKHVILLGDGDAYDSSYQSLIQNMHAQGITVSTVAVGADPNGASMLAQFAQWGHGRFYQSNNLSDIPQIFLKETQEALKPWIVEGSITPRLASLVQILPSLPLDTFPVLGGYVATTPRAAADVVLKSPQGDPLLATWQYGLGRVVAWTSDAEGRWTAGLLRWPSSNLFFGDLVRASLAGPGDPAVQVQTQIQGDHTHLVVSVPALSGSAVTVGAVAPDLQTETVSLDATGAGRFEGDLLTDQVGSYVLHVTQTVGSATRHADTTGLVVPYSPEYRDLGTELGSLRAIARAGGGAVLTDLSQVFRLPVPPVTASHSLSELLLALAIILFPLDVALRRLVFHAEDLPAWRKALVPARAPAKAAPAEATLARLRERVDGIRVQRQPPVKPRPGAGLPPPSPPPARPDDPTGELLARRRGRR